MVAVRLCGLCVVCGVWWCGACLVCVVDFLLLLIIIVNLIIHANKFQKLYCATEQVL